MELLLDSVILIDHFNDVPEATEYLEETEGKVLEVQVAENVVQLLEELT